MQLHTAHTRNLVSCMQDTKKQILAKGWTFSLWEGIFFLENLWPLLTRANDQAHFHLKSKKDGTMIVLTYLQQMVKPSYIPHMGLWEKNCDLTPYVISPEPWKVFVDNIVITLDANQHHTATHWAKAKCDNTGIRSVCLRMKISEASKIIWVFRQRWHTQHP